MRNNPLAGAGYVIRGFRLVFKPRIRRFVLIPLAINVLVFAGLIYALYVGTGELSAMLAAELPSWLEWLRFLLWPLFVIAALLMVAFGFALVGNFVAAPFNGFLAEAVELHLTGRPIETEHGWSAFAKELARSLGSELGKLGYALVRAVPILVLLWVPVVNAVASILWFVLGAWLLALQYADYPMANHGLTFRMQRERLARRRFLTLGFGGALMLVTLVPVLNFFVIPAGVAGATAMWVDEFSRLGEADE